MIQEVFKAEGLPLDLAYIPLIESAFKPVAQSQKRARGVWQFMRATGEERGLETNWFVDERSDPEKSTRAAARLPEVALQPVRRLAPGAGLVQRRPRSRAARRGAQRASRTSGGCRDGKRHLPRETREYVPLILAAMVVARNPTQYGFTPMATDKPLAYDSVTVTRAVDLRRIAEWTDTPLEAIQALNPELRRWTTPVRAERYDVKVPPGTGDKLRERLASAPASRPRRAALVSRQARRIGRDDRAQAGREPRRSRRSERAVGQGAGPTRSGSAGAARAVHRAGGARRDAPPRPPATRAPPRRPRRAASGRRIRRAARAWSTRCAAATRSRRSPAPSTRRSPRSSRPTSCAAATSPPAIASRSTARRATARATQ